MTDAYVCPACKHWRETITSMQAEMNRLRKDLRKAQAEDELWRIQVDAWKQENHRLQVENRNLKNGITSRQAIKQILEILASEPQPNSE